MTYSGAARLGRAVLRGDRQSQEQQGKAPKRIMQELSSTPLEKVIVSGLALPRAGLAAWQTRAVSQATCGSHHDLAYDGPQPAATQTHAEEEGIPGLGRVTCPLQRYGAILGDQGLQTASRHPSPPGGHL